MRRIPFTLLAGLAALASLLGSCARRGQVITIHGSDTMVILGQRWAERYMAEHPGVVIQVTGGGSGAGIAALINGSTEICQSSRPMKPAEREELAAKYGGPPHERVVARDGLTVFLHPSNPVSALSVEELRRIYRGEVKNWRELGGRDAPIVVYGRENNSGTYVFFKEHVLDNADFAPAVQTLTGTGAVVNAVAQDPNGIGYGGAAYSSGIKVCALAPESGAAPVLPEEEAVASGAYPLARDLFFYLRAEPEGATREFIDWVVSEDGQSVVLSVGYFPLPGLRPGGPA
jgi:phosphate transport system substrate-binding protein